MSNDASTVLIDGPWEHRLVAANGARFHVAEMGEGPLVLLLHGFPQFWWAWRHQMTALAEGGYRAAAMDLRGYGGSDKPPRGYDTFTLAADVASVIRSLGETEAVVAGHGWGGWIAWSMPTMQPSVTRAVAALGMPHPLVLRRASFTDPGQMRANAYLGGLQRPFVPERQMTNGPGYVERLLRHWSSPENAWPGDEEAERYGEAMAIPFVAHSAAEYYRWVVRSQLRLDGGGSPHGCAGRSRCRCCTCTASTTARSWRRRPPGHAVTSADRSRSTSSPAWATSCPRRPRRRSTSCCCAGWSTPRRPAPPRPERR